MPKENKIAIIGLGYVGLPLAIAFSKFYKVIGFDIDTDRVNELLSASNTAEAKYNMGLIQVEEGKYEEAITSMGETKSFNVALAQLLAGHNDDASQTLDANEDNPALNYYLKAIIGARTNNSEMVMDNLKSAFEKDASLKDKAKTDREFIKFFENADFLAIF